MSSCIAAQTPASKALWLDQGSQAVFELDQWSGKAQDASTKKLGLDCVERSMAALTGAQAQELLRDWDQTQGHMVVLSGSGVCFGEPKPCGPNLHPALYIHLLLKSQQPCQISMQEAQKSSYRSYLRATFCLPP